MKRFILFFAFILISVQTWAQSDIKINYVSDKEVFLNELELSSKTTFDDIKKILGEPVLYKEYPATGKTNYHYKDLGLSVHIVDGHLLFIGANFNWDGDETFPDTPYKNGFEIDGVKIDLNSSDSMIEEMKKVEIACLFPGLCMSKDKKSNAPIIMGFKDDKVTQVGFEFR